MKKRRRAKPFTIYLPVWVYDALLAGPRGSYRYDDALTWLRDRRMIR